jgi:hypothetical protein
MAEENRLIKTLDRSQLYAVQTPQGFSRELLVRAYEEAYRKNCYGTDDAYLVEQAGEKVVLVKGDYSNIKITTMEDIVFGEAILGGKTEERGIGGLFKSSLAGTGPLNGLSEDKGGMRKLVVAGEGECASVRVMTYKAGSRPEAGPGRSKHSL